MKLISYRHKGRIGWLKLREREHSSCFWKFDHCSYVVEKQLVNGSYCPQSWGQRDFAYFSYPSVCPPTITHPRKKRQA